MFISHFEVIDSKSGSVVFQTTLWDALGDTIAFSFAPPLDENHPDESRTPPPPSISLGTAVIPRRNKKQRLCKMLRGGGGRQSVISNHVTMETTRSTNAAKPLLSFVYLFACSIDKFNSLEMFIQRSRLYGQFDFANSIVSVNIVLGPRQT